MRHAEEVVAQTYVERQRWIYFELVLDVGAIRRVPRAHDAFALQVPTRVRLVVYEVGVCQVRHRGGGQGVAGVVQPDASDVDPGLYRVAPQGLCKVVDIGERR